LSSHEFLDWYKKPEPYEGVPAPKPTEPGGVKAAPWCDYAYKEWEIYEKKQIPDWWWKFEPPAWSEEELLFMERILLKMHENIAKEKMTPMDRYWSTAYGIERDRSPIIAGNYCLATSASRLLDSFGVVIKPIDLHRYPKLHLMASMLAPASFATDLIFIYKITYAEAEYGGHVYAKEASAPVCKKGGAQDTGFLTPDIPFRTAPFLSFKMPDPRGGALGMQLWQLGSIKEYLRKAGLWGIQPLQANTCMGPMNTAGAALGPTLGIGEIGILYRRRPEWVHAAFREALKFCIAHNRLVRDAGSDIVFFCDGLNIMSPKMTADLVQYHVDLCKQVHYPPGGHCVTAGDFSNHIDIVLQAHGKYAYLIGTDHVYDIKQNVKKAIEYDKMWFNFPDWDVVKAGPKERIQAYEKERYAIAQSDPKSKYCNPGPTDYWLTLEYYEEWVQTCKKYGSYPKGWEQP